LGWVFKLHIAQPGLAIYVVQPLHDFLKVFPTLWGFSELLKDFINILCTPVYDILGYSIYELFVFLCVVFPIIRPEGIIYCEQCVFGIFFLLFL
jgi:hypothetical protein